VFVCVCVCMLCSLVSELLNGWVYIYACLYKLLHTCIYIYIYTYMGCKCNTATHVKSSWCDTCNEPHCNTLKHTATHCNTYVHTCARVHIQILTCTCAALHESAPTLLAGATTHCSTLQHTATHCNTLHYTSKPPNLETYMQNY